jgi:hypothetical protein
MTLPGVRILNSPTTHGRVEKLIESLLGKPEGKRPPGRRRLRWEDNIRMDLREIVWEVVDWMHLALDRDQWRVLMNTVMNLRVP